MTEREEFNLAVSNLRKAINDQTGSEILVPAYDLAVVLKAQKRVLDKIPFGMVVTDTHGMRWVCVGTSKLKGKTDHYKFTREVDGSYYHAADSETLLKKFPSLQEWVI